MPLLYSIKNIKLERKMKMILITGLALTSMSVFAQTEIKSEKGETKPEREIEKSQATQEAQVALVPQVEQERSSWMYGVGISLGMNSKVTFDEITTSITTNKMTADLDYDDAFSIELDARNLKHNALGFMYGVTLDMPRKFSGGRLSGNGRSVAISANNPDKFQTTVVFANAVYQWNDIYIPFGLNFGFVKYTPESGFNGSYSASGSIGAQLGIGYNVKKNFVVEGYSRAVAVNLKMVDSGTAIDFGTGYLSTIQFTLKYLYN